MLLWSVSLSPIVFHIPYYPSHQKKAFISVFIILNFIWKHKECSLFVISHYINQDSSIDNPHFFIFQSKLISPVCLNYKKSCPRGQLFL